MAWLGQWREKSGDDGAGGEGKGPLVEAGDDAIALGSGRAARAMVRATAATGVRWSPARLRDQLRPGRVHAGARSVSNVSRKSPASVSHVPEPSCRYRGGAGSRSPQAERVQVVFKLCSRVCSRLFNPCSSGVQGTVHGRAVLTEHLPTPGPSIRGGFNARARPLLA